MITSYNFGLLVNASDITKKGMKKKDAVNIRVFRVDSVSEMPPVSN